MADYFNGPDASHRDDDDDAAAISHALTVESIQPVPPPSTAPLRPNGGDGVMESQPQPTRHPRRVRSSSIRIRRLPSTIRQSNASSIPEAQIADVQAPPPDVIVRDHAEQDEEFAGRRRSMSAPERREDVVAAAEASSRPNSTFMPIIQEGRPIPPGRPATPSNAPAVPDAASPTSPKSVATRSSSRLSRPPLFGRIRSGYRSSGIFGDDPEKKRESRASSNAGVGDFEKEDEEYHDEVANILDVVDPEVSTLSTLTNVQNSLFVPDLGRLINRRPTYRLSTVPSAEGGYDTDTTDEFLREAQEVADAQAAEDDAQSFTAGPDDITIRRRNTQLTRTGSITSQITESRYAVLPHGVHLDGWSQEDKEALNDHVRHMLHSRRSKMKRSLKGFVKYIQRPLGFLVTLYAVCITVFGLVWVLFLIGWISGGSDARHKYLINVIDNVLVALFAVVGDGLAPFRAVDTYHMIFIARYARLTWKVRKQERMPKLENRNDLPTTMSFDVEMGSAESKGEKELSVLTPKQQRRLAHHQKKFARSHTFYKPHETTTHYAFSIRLLITIVVLLDAHSLFQIALGACTWGWDWHTRPAVVTTVILCCSITVNITAGILISVGDRRSRKVEVVEQMFRQTLTQEAIKKVERHKREREAREAEEHEAQRMPFEGT